jgi:hypothetical protein
MLVFGQYAFRFNIIQLIENCFPILKIAERISIHFVSLLWWAVKFNSSVIVCPGTPRIFRTVSL